MVVRHILGCLWSLIVSHPTCLVTDGLRDGSVTGLGLVIHLGKPLLTE